MNTYVCSVLLIMFHGCIVAILFCLMNSEVISELKKYFGQYHQSLHGPQSLALTQYTVIQRFSIPYITSSNNVVSHLEVINFRKKSYVIHMILRHCTK